MGKIFFSNFKFFKGFWMGQNLTFEGDFKPFFWPFFKISEVEYRKNSSSFDLKPRREGFFFISNFLLKKKGPPPPPTQYPFPKKLIVFCGGIIGIFSLKKPQGFQNLKKRVFFWLQTGFWAWASFFHISFSQGGTLFFSRRFFFGFSVKNPFIFAPFF